MKPHKQLNQTIIRKYKEIKTTSKGKYRKLQYSTLFNKRTGNTLKIKNRIRRHYLKC